MRNIVDQASETASNVASKATEMASNVRNQAGEMLHHVGDSPLAKTAGRIPTDAFLIAAAGSIVGSLVLKLMGRQKDADFIGHWAPTLISLGLLSKLVEHDEHMAEHAAATAPKRSRRSPGNSTGE